MGSWLDQYTGKGAGSWIDQYLEETPAGPPVDITAMARSAQEAERQAMMAAGAGVPATDEQIAAAEAAAAGPVAPALARHLPQAGTIPPALGTQLIEPQPPPQTAGEWLMAPSNIARGVMESLSGADPRRLEAGVLMGTQAAGAMGGAGAAVAESLGNLPGVGQAIAPWVQLVSQPMREVGGRAAQEARLTRAEIHKGSKDFWKAFEEDPVRAMANEGLEQIPVLVGMVGASIATGSAFLPAFILEGGLSWDRAKQENATDAEALTALGIAGTVNAALEKSGASKIAGAAKDRVVPALREILKASLYEGATEGWQEFFSETARLVAYAAEKPSDFLELVSPENRKQYAASTLIGAVTGAGVAAGMAAVPTIQQPSRAETKAAEEYQRKQEQLRTEAAARETGAKADEARQMLEAQAKRQRTQARQREALLGTLPGAGAKEIRTGQRGPGFEEVAQPPAPPQRIEQQPMPPIRTAFDMTDDERLSLGSELSDQVEAMGNLSDLDRQVAYEALERFVDTGQPAELVPLTDEPFNLAPFDAASRFKEQKDADVRDFRLDGDTYKLDKEGFQIEVQETDRGYRARVKTPERGTITDVPAGDVLDDALRTALDKYAADRARFKPTARQEPEVELPPEPTAAPVAPEVPPQAQPPSEPEIVAPGAAQEAEPEARYESFMESTEKPATEQAQVAKAKDWMLRYIRSHPGISYGDAQRAHPLVDDGDGPMWWTNAVYSAMQELEAEGSVRKDTSTSPHGYSAEAAQPVDRTRPKPPDAKGMPDLSVVEGQAVTQADPKTIAVDPYRFQFRSDVDEEGVLIDKSQSNIADAQVWNRSFAGVVSVWLDPNDNKTYVVDGHHRLWKAKQLGVEEIDIRYVPAKSVEEARATGALINMAQGSGTSIDVAKFMRDTGAAIEDLEGQGISLTKGMVAEGTRLAELEEGLFLQVVNENITKRKGAIIGDRLGGLDDAQRQLGQMVKKMGGWNKVTEGQLRELADEIVDSPTVQGSLGGVQTSFLGDTEVEVSLAPQRAAIKDYIRRRLKSEKGIFGAAVRNAEVLEKHGSRIAREEAGRISEAAKANLGIFDELKNKSRVREIIDDAARRLHEGESENAVKQQAYEDVVSALPEVLKGGALADRPGRGPGVEGQPAAAPAVTEEEEPAPPTNAELEAAGQEGMFGSLVEPEGETPPEPTPAPEEVEAIDQVPEPTGEQPTGITGKPAYPAGTKFVKSYESRGHKVTILKLGDRQYKAELDGVPLVGVDITQKLAQHRAGLSIDEIVKREARILELWRSARERREVDKPRFKKGDVVRRTKPLDTTTAKETGDDGSEFVVRSVTYSGTGKNRRVSGYNLWNEKAKISVTPAASKVDELFELVEPKKPAAARPKQTGKVPNEEQPPAEEAAPAEAKEVTATGVSHYRDRSDNTPFAKVRLDDPSMPGVELTYTAYGNKPGGTIKEATAVRTALRKHEKAKADIPPGAPAPARQDETIARFEWDEHGGFKAGDKVAIKGGKAGYAEGTIDYFWATRTHKTWMKPGMTAAWIAEVKYEDGTTQNIAVERLSKAEQDSLFAGLPVKIRDESHKDDLYQAIEDNPTTVALTRKELEINVQEGKLGRKRTTMTDRFKEAMLEFVHGFSREMRRIPHGEKHAWFREIMRIVRVYPDIAADLVSDDLKGAYGELTDAEYDLFVKKTLFDDARDVREVYGESFELPMGMTDEDLQIDGPRIDDQVAANKNVREAVEAVHEVWEKTRNEVRPAFEAIGLDTSYLDRRDGHAYMHHEVLQYTHDQLARRGLSKALKAPEGRSFQRRMRGGKEQLLNLAYTEAQGAVLTQLRMDAKIAEALKDLRDEHDIAKELKDKAKGQNRTRFYRKHQEALMEKGMTEGDAYDAVHGDHDPLAVFRQRIAIGNSMIYRLSIGYEDKEGNYHTLPAMDSRFDAMIEDMQDGYREHLHWQSELDKEDPDKGASFIFDDPLWWDFLRSLVKDHGGEDGSGAAATIFKAIDRRDAAIREYLGNEFVEWGNLIPEDHKRWKPSEGSIFYRGMSLVDRLAKRIIEGEILEVTKDDLKPVVIRAAPKPDWVLPVEIVETLEAMERAHMGALARGGAAAQQKWKIWQLMMPRRAFKYGLRNYIGDNQAIVTFRPKAYQHYGRAGRELADFIYNGNFPGGTQGDFFGWFDLGGVNAGMIQQEINRTEAERLRRMLRSKEFKDFLRDLKNNPGEIATRYFDFIRKHLRFLEAVQRYAMYLQALEDLENGRVGKPESPAVNYWASIKEEIDAIAKHDKKRAAYWLSNEALIAYDSVSEWGQFLRRYHSPFWSFQEGNLRRYYRGIRNAVRSDSTALKLAGRVGVTPAKYGAMAALRVGKFLGLAMSLEAVLWALNHGLHPDEEEDLPIQVRRSTHLIFGRDDRGNVLYFNRLSVFREFREWFGLAEFPHYVMNWLDNKMSTREVVQNMLKDTANKAWQAIGPFPWKAPVELIMGRQTFPDAFRSKKFLYGTDEDKWVQLGDYFSQQFGLENEYRSAVGLPQKWGDYRSSWWQALVYSAEPNAGSYFDALTLKNQFLEHTGEAQQGEHFSAKSHALRNFKRALRYGQKDVAAHALMVYKNREGTKRGIQQSLRMMNPNYGIPKDKREEFRQWMTPEDHEVWEKAELYYETVLNPKAPGVGREIIEAVFKTKELPEFVPRK